MIHSILTNSLYIHNEDDFLPENTKTNFVGTSHQIIPHSNSGNFGKKYLNPFREYDISSFPKDLQEQLEQFSVLQQIAILRDPKLQQRYFPQYCNS